ncbi:DUF4383 domain-containing protein [Prauserella flavalba]|uniref:DUF4383 domain-containing protein n=1 Tax=Prauserella flavalba TaxID=1477506 RepID=UPI0036E64D6E
MSTASSATGRGLVARLSWPQVVVGVVALWYLVMGITGFALHDGMGPESSRTVWVFGVSTLLNIMHTAVGVLALIATRKAVTARLFGWASFFAFAGLTAYSILATVLDEWGDLVNVKAANAWLYGATCLIGLVLALGGVRTRRP